MKNEEKQKVFIIGRYNWLKQENLNDLPKMPFLDVEFLTAHKSKGREADYTILIGLKGGRMGFPCQIVDDKILDLVLAKGDPFPNAEERRLFYVALTRAKKHVYIINEPCFLNSSSFVSEILIGGYEINSEGQPPQSILCPICKTGEIILKDGQYSQFYQCNNYPYCDYTPETCPDCAKGFLTRRNTRYHCSNIECSFSAMVCPSCGGYLKKKTKNGDFLGCSNYTRGCRYTQPLGTSRPYRRRTYNNY